MAIALPSIVIDHAAPDHAQHLTTDINNALNRISAAAVATDTEIADVVSDVADLTADFATLTPLAFSASGADIVNATIPNAKFSEVATTTASGPIEIATAAEVTTATDSTRAVTPSTVVAHPGVAKAFGIAVGTTGVLQTAYNLTSLTRTGTGAYDVVIATDFTGAEFVVIPSIEHSAAVLVVQVLTGKTAGTFTLVVNTLGGVLADPNRVSFVCYGPQ